MKRLFSVLLVVSVLLCGTVMTVSAEVPDPGSGKTNIFLQNIGVADAQVNLVFTTGETGGQAWTTDTGGAIPPKASKYLLYPNFGGSITDGWAGAVEVSATEPLAAIVNMFWDRQDGIQTAATYTGVDSPATEVYLPNLLVRDGRQTRVTVQNTEDAVANITMNFYNRNGNAVGSKSDTIPAKSEKTYYLHQVSEANFSATAGTGSAHITSNKKIAAVVSLHYPASSAAYTGVTSGDTTLWVPGVFRKKSGSTWINYNATIVQNLGSAAANVTIQFLNRDSSVAHQMTDVIQPKASSGYNMITAGTVPQAKYDAMAADLGENWSGTIKFLSDQPLAGLSLYFPVSTGVTDNLAYNAIRDSDATTKALSFPAVYRKLPGNTSDQWSTTLIQNLSGNAGTLQVEFYGTDGLKKGSTYTVPIPANGSVALNLLAGINLPQQALNDLGTFFSGGLYVTPSAGLRIVGVTDIFFTGTARASGYGGFPVP